METIRFLQGAASPVLDDIALVITNLGGETSYIALLVITYLAFGPASGRRLGIYFLVAIYFNGLLKGLFDTARPYLLDPDVLRSPEAGETGTGGGFPSGHAQGSATFWGIAALYVRRRPFTLLALLVITAVSLSRIYLGVHLPIDVVGGLALGALAVLAVPLLDRLSLPLGPLAQVVGAVALPLAVHLLAPTPDSGLVLGGLAGFLLAPFLYRYRLPAGVVARAGAALLGLALVFALLFASSALLPEAVKRDDLGGYLRYLLLALTGLVLAPWLFDLLARRRPAPARQPAR